MVKSNNAFEQAKKEMKRLVEEAKSKGLIKPHTMAFKEFPVSQEAHKGKKGYFCNWDMKIVQEKYEIGDIVFVSKYSYDTGEMGTSHLFVIIEDDNQLVPAEYFGMIASSHIEKSKEVSEFKYNEPLKKTPKNGLRDDSITKCDVVYRIPKENIQFKIGSVEVDDYLRFMDSYKTYLKEKEATLV